MIVLNTIVSKQLADFKIEVEAQLKKGVELEQAILQILKGYITNSKKILFEGNNYSEEWVKMAHKRGLSNLKNTPEALAAYIHPKSIELFEQTQVLSHREVDARYEILLEMYMKQIQIESRVLGELALGNVIPVAIEYQNKILQNISLLRAEGLNEEADQMREFVKKISGHINVVRSKVFEMIDARRDANNKPNAKEQAMAYCKEVKPYFEVLRYHIDKLELYIEDGLWPFPKYTELLFIK